LEMANRSLCAIDEFSKVSVQDQVALQEAMSIGTISIAKASIVATLPAQTSILAGGNPKLGRFDPYIPIREQVAIDEVLLSRFDLRFALRDIPNPELDERLAEKPNIGSKSEVTRRTSGKTQESRVIGKTTTQDIDEEFRQTIQGAQKIIDYIESIKAATPQHPYLEIKNSTIELRIRRLLNMIKIALHPIQNVTQVQVGDLLLPSKGKADKAKAYIVIHILDAAGIVPPFGLELAYLGGRKIRIHQVLEEELKRSYLYISSAEFKNIVTAIVKLSELKREIELQDLEN